MSNVAETKTGSEEFLAWVAGREGRFELVDGDVLMMAGAGPRHDKVVVNLIVGLAGRLKGGPCQPTTSDRYVAIPSGNRRQPDVGVECGRPDEASIVMDQPALVIEVWSPTNSHDDKLAKVTEYKTVPSVNYILCVNLDEPKAVFASKTADGHWVDVNLTGLDAVISMPLLGINLTLDEVFAGLTFPPRPRLVTIAD